MNEEKERDYSVLPFHSPDEKEEWCKFRCTQCKALDNVPGFVVDEFKMGLEEGEEVGFNV